MSSIVIFFKKLLFGFSLSLTLGRYMILMICHLRFSKLNLSFLQEAYSRSSLAEKGRQKGNPRFQFCNYCSLCHSKAFEPLIDRKIWKHCKSSYYVSMSLREELSLLSKIFFLPFIQYFF